MSVLIHLRQFEGPLGLLLYLIKKEEMDIFDIKINEITKQYLEYIQVMRELDLETAGEFVAMAATLIQIKSRMLLPQYNEQGEEIKVEDPRKELVQRLLEYQKFQEAAHNLQERPLVNRDVWLRARRENLHVEDDSVELEENGLFSLIASYRRVIRTMEKSVHKVRAKVQSIASRVLEIKARLIVGSRLRMAELLSAEEPESRRKQLLITFLAMLELGKMGLVRLFQNEPYSDIYVEAQRAIESDVLSRVEEYDSANAENLADQLTAVAESAVAEKESVQGTLGVFEGEMLDEESGFQASQEAATDDEIAQAEAEFGENVVNEPELV